jgi:NNP family nitrate/nitrite transporter-like MFS transporter
VSFWVFIGQIVATLGMIWFLGMGSFLGFFAMVLVLFFVSGVGNASTFQMVPGIMRIEIDRTAAELPVDERRRQAERESAAIIGFISAIAAYGAFYIPKAYGSSIASTGTADMALWGFLIFYVTCAAMTWWVYSGPRGVLREAERRPPTPQAVTA